MKPSHLPYATLFICLLTLLCSTCVAFHVTGNFFGDVKITKLEPYGGITFAHLRDGQLWRLFTAQLIHVKQFHMLYNVVSLAALGIYLERELRPIKFFLLWLIPGAIGTLVGTIAETPPWNLGTGASQAVLAIAGFGLVLLLKGKHSPKLLIPILAFAFIPAFLLDMLSVGFPKPGHLVAATIGAIAGYAHISHIKQTPIANSPT